MIYKSKKNNIYINSINNNAGIIRKKQHLDISLGYDIQSKKIGTGLEKYYFVHQALPEIDLDEIDLSTSIFGKKLNIPLMISPLTGGIEESDRINEKLAEVAQAKGIAMGVGSQRIAIEQIKSSSIFRIREAAPDILLFANIGAVQLNYGFGIKECRAAVDMIKADGLMLHLNPLQEVFQDEGNHNFKNLLSKIGYICSNLKCPVVVREVGFGISKNVAQRLIGAGVSGIDISGAGGTSWIEIEKIRSQNKMLKKIAEDFDKWGIPTSESLEMVRELNPDIPVIASGGIRKGIDVAKVIALGADLVGIALPVLEKINHSIQSCINFIEEIEMGLKIAMFGIGAFKIEELKKSIHLKKKVLDNDLFF